MLADMPSVLQSQLESPTGLNLSSEQFNLLYAIYAWTNAVVVIGAGLFIDKVGSRIGLMVFSSLCLIGGALFALVSYDGRGKEGC